MPLYAIHEGAVEVDVAPTHHVESRIIEQDLVLSIEGEPVPAPCGQIMEVDTGVGTRSSLLDISDEPFGVVVVGDEEKAVKLKLLHDVSLHLRYVGAARHGGCHV